MAATISLLNLNFSYPMKQLNALLLMLLSMLVKI